MIPIFIPSYHRPDNLKTVKYFKKLGWRMSDIYVFIDSEADDKVEYEMVAKKDGFNLVVFDMEEARSRYDYIHRPSKARRSAGQARNMFQDYAKKVGIGFYCVQDDDTTDIQKRWKGKRGNIVCKNVDEVLETFEAVRHIMNKWHIGCMAISQTGDLIGGDGSLKVWRWKVMNCTFYDTRFIYRGERGVQDDDTSMFVGMYNEGYFTGSLGRGLVLSQTTSAKASGGLTDLYNECKLLNKAMVCPIQFPSAICGERQRKNGNRLHHRIKGRYLIPRLIKVGPSGRSNIAWDVYPEDAVFSNEPKRKI